MKDEFRTYRIWFYAATVYNTVWGLAVVLFPGPLLGLLGLHDPAAYPFVQGIGMIVGVYAYGYFLLARDPVRYANLVWIGLAGKTFGPVGFLYTVLAGILPTSLFWVTLTNDLIWWPAFWSFALRHARRPLE